MSDVILPVCIYIYICCLFVCVHCFGEIYQNVVKRTDYWFCPLYCIIYSFVLHNPHEITRKRVVVVFTALLLLYTIVYYDSSSIKLLLCICMYTLARIFIHKPPAAGHRGYDVFPVRRVFHYSSLSPSRFSFLA